MIQVYRKLIKYMENDQVYRKMIKYIENDQVYRKMIQYMVTSRSKSEAELLGPGLGSSSDSFVSFEAPKI